MPAIQLNQFGGMFPAWDAHLIPPGQASFAKNGFLFSGALVGWRKPKELRTLDNSAARMVYRVPTVSQTQARALFVFKLQPNAGDTMSVGDLTYTWRATLETQDDESIGLPFEVLIGATTAESARNFAAALTADNGENTHAGEWYGANTVRNGDVKFYLPDTPLLPGIIGPTAGSDDIGGTTYQFVEVGAEDVGAAFNLIRLSESTSNARTTWLYDVLSFTHTTATYRGGTNPTFDTRITGTAVWLEFEDPDTNVIRSPVVDDQFNRYYFASPSQMPQYTTYDRIQNGDDPWLLGVPPPGCAPTISVVGGGNDLTLGNNTEAAGQQDAKANRIYLMKVTTPGATQIQSVSIVGSTNAFPDAGYPDAHWHAVIYSNSDGKPDVLLNTGQIVTGFQADDVNVSTFVNPTNLEADVDYWIGFALDAPIHAFNVGPAGGPNNHMVSWPNTFTNGPNVTAPVTQLAHSQITSDGANPVDGDVMVIGLSTYTFKNTVVAVNQIKIGASVAATLSNIEHAINDSGGTPGTDYSVPGANFYVQAAAPASLAIGLTIRSASLGDGSNVPTTFTPVGSAHLSFPDGTLQVGYTEGLTEFEMFGSFVTSDVIESRSYVYTWVSEYGEEGPPSPPVLLDGWSNATWTLGLWQPPPNDLGVLRNLKKVNIYRTVPGSGGTTVFFFVATVDIGVEEYVDTNPNSTVALNDQLQSTNWFPPPENMQGLTVMQNGMIAGFIGNEVWFCEPYHPHAWPPAYVATVDYPIVGMGLTNGALVVCTSAKPFVFAGTAPASMAQTKCEGVHPCSSRASILGGDGAVTYMSPNGLIQVTAAGVATNTTDVWFTREKWESLVPQHDTRAVALASSYYCLGTVSVDGTDTSVAQQGFTVELAQDNTSFSIWPQPGGHRLGFQELDAPVDDKDTQNVLTDPWSSNTLVIADGKVWWFDFTDTAPELKVATWKSKWYQQNTARSYSAMKAYFTVPDGTPALNPERFEEDADDPGWVDLPADRYAFIKTYVDLDGDGTLRLIDAREIRKTGEVLRIVDGFKAETWVWEIQTRVPISSVQIATSIKELAKV